MAKKGSDVYMFANPGVVEPDGPGEDDLQQAIAALHVDHLLGLFATEVERRGLQNLPLANYLYYKLQSIQLYEMIDAIWAKAWYDLDVLRSNYRSCFTEDNVPLWNSNFWHGEVGDGTGATMYRVLVPLKLAVQVFQKADAKHFYENGTARFSVVDYRGPGNPRMVRMQVDGSKWVNPWIGVQWRFVELGMSCPGDEGVLEVTAVELGLDYTKQDTRFMLQRPATQQVGQEFLRGWAKVLESTKLTQMQVEDAHAWPGEAARPWNVTDLARMPVLVWGRCVGT